MKDLTKGNIMKLLIGFAVPLLIGNIFQQLYNVVDTKVVGEILGKDALAALGASGPIYNMIVGALMGLGNGFGIVIAKFHGAKQMERMRQAVANAVSLSFSITVVITALSLILIEPLLKMLHTPEEIMPRCIAYIRIIIWFMIFTTAYNLSAWIFCWSVY